LAKQKKVTALSGAYPDSASRSEQDYDKAAQQYLSLSGWRCKTKDFAKLLIESDVAPQLPTRATSHPFRDTP